MQSLPIQCAYCDWSHILKDYQVATISSLPLLRWRCFLLLCRLISIKFILIRSAFIVMSRSLPFIFLTIIRHLNVQRLLCTAFWESLVVEERCVLFVLICRRIERWWWCLDSTMWVAWSLSQSTTSTLDSSCDWTDEISTDRDKCHQWQHAGNESTERTRWNYEDIGKWRARTARRDPTTAEWWPAGTWEKVARANRESIESGRWNRRRVWITRWTNSKYAKFISNFDGISRERGWYANCIARWHIGVEDNRSRRETSWVYNFSTSDCSEKICNRRIEDSDIRIGETVIAFRNFLRQLFLGWLIEGDNIFRLFL